MNRVLRRWAPLLAVGALLVAAWIAAVLSSPQINNVPVRPLRIAGSLSPTIEPSVQSATPAETASSEEAATEVEAPDERGGLIAVVVVVGILTVGGVAGWVIIRRRVAATAEDPLVFSRKVASRPARRAESVAEAVDAGISALSDSEADPRRAVIACWVRLEQAAASAGTRRHPGDSPTDLVVRLLHEQRVSRESLDGLAAVYRQARYATHTIDERMRATAVAALQQVRSDLGARRAAGGGPGGGPGSRSGGGPVDAAGGMAGGAGRLNGRPAGSTEGR